MGINKICVPAFSGTKKKFNIFFPESLDRAAEHASQLSGWKQEKLVIEKIS